MDEADREIEMEKDPFLAAGIDIPEELPYLPSPRPSIIQQNDQMEVNVEKKSSIISDTDQSSNGERNNSRSLNLEKKSIPEVSFEPPTPTTSIPYYNASFDSTTEPNHNGD